MRLNDGPKFVMSTYYGATPVLNITDPDIIKDVMVKDFNVFPNRHSFFDVDSFWSKNIFSLEDNDWRRVRSIVTPVLSTTRVRQLCPIVSQCVRQLVDDLSTGARSDSHVIDVSQYYKKYVIDSILRCFFRIKLDASDKISDEFVGNYEKFLNYNKWKLLSLEIFDGFFAKLFAIKSPIDESIKEFCVKLCKELINEYKTSGMANLKERDQYFIHTLINLSIDNNNEERHTVLKNKYLTEEEVIENSAIFLNAGYESSSNILLSTTYELARNPGVQQKLYEEVVGIINEDRDGNDITDYYEALPKLKYMDAVIMEVIRLYITSEPLKRLSNSRYTFRKIGLTIDKGTRVEIPTQAINTCDEYFPDATQFIPERFMDREANHQYPNLPFGSGPRGCLGKVWAVMQLKLCLVGVIRRYRFASCDIMADNIEWKLNLFGNRNKQMFVKIAERLSSEADFVIV
ncbi:unnamed protein product [Oppiella nova]|uniref:Cytochrome P450 n=1 Tax=Oppiella nova TaxID=334625 RepID=A0A7R9LKD2_9ACAR|nr:unnamed protein product [Oppiella nova]CAG2164096.1 unnamed protein product [Oppiella nova]